MRAALQARTPPSKSRSFGLKVRPGGLISGGIAQFPGGGMFCMKSRRAPLATQADILRELHPRQNGHVYASLFKSHILVKPGGGGRYEKKTKACDCFKRLLEQRARFFTDEVYSRLKGRAKAPVPAKACS